MGQTSSSRRNRPEDGDLVYVHYKAIREKGCVYENSFNTSIPYAFIVGTPCYAHWFNRILKKLVLNEVYSVVIHLEDQPPHLHFPTGIFTDELVTIELKLVKIVKKKKLENKHRPLSIHKVHARNTI